MSCIFIGYGACNNERDNALPLICKNHMNVIFGLSKHVDQVASIYGSKRLTKLEFTKTRDLVIPFPFEVSRNATGNIDSSSNLCQQAPNSSDIWSNLATFVSQIDVQNKSTLIQSLVNALSNGFIITDPMVSVNAEYTLQAIQNNTMNAVLNSRWRDVKVQVRHTLNGVVTIDELPMLMLPKLYQVLLFHAEISVQENDNGSKFTMQPNLQLCLDKGGFIKIEQNRVNPIYINTTGTTFATPVILAGRAKGNGENTFEHSLIAMREPLFNKYVPICPTTS